jgi:hypothetical protein
VFAAPPAEPPAGVRLVGVSDVMEALTWAAVEGRRSRRGAEGAEHGL